MSNLLTKKISLSRPTKAGQVHSQENSVKTKSPLLEFVINNYRFFIVLVCLAVMAGSFFGFFWPQYKQTLSEVDNNYQQAQLELVQKQKYQANLIKLNDFYKKIDQASRDKVVDILPVALDKENLLAEIETICLSNNLLIKSSDVVVGPAETQAASNPPDSSSGSGQLKMATIKLELQGKDYQSLKGLLKTTENNLHLMDIQKLDYVPGKNQIILDIQIYYLSN